MTITSFWLIFAKTMVRVGVIGLGFAQAVHIPAFRLDSRAQIVAIAGRDLTRTQLAAKNLSIPKAYDQASKLICDPAVDVVAIAVPPAAQGDLILESLLEGKHVFFEKPLGYGSSMGMKLLEVANQKALIHMIDFEFPELPTWKAAKDLIDRKTLGELRSLQISWQMETLANKKGLNTWKTDPSQKGGTLYNFGSHIFYNLEWMLGSIAEILYSEENQLLQLLVRFQSGLRGSVLVTPRSPYGSGHRIELQGSEGAIVLENKTADYMNGFSLTLWPSDGLASLPPKEDPAQDGRIHAVGSMVHRFLDAIENKTNAKPGLAEAIRVEQCIERCLESARSRSWLTI